jgi:hypothetical protein
MSVRDYSDTTKPLFELPEQRLMDAICEKWRLKQRVSSKWVRDRMSMLVQQALKKGELGGEARALLQGVQRMVLGLRPPSRPRLPRPDNQEGARAPP